MKHFKKLLGLFFLFFVLISSKVQAQEPDSILNRYVLRAVSAQSAACYDDYLVYVSKKVSRVYLYNLASKKTLYTCKLEPKNEHRGTTEVFHSNNSSFSKYKYEEDDFFPLLYVSHRENNDLRGVLDVYRIIPFKKDDSLDFDSISVQQVQTIYFPVMSDKNALGSPWAAIDLDNDKIYTYSRNNRKRASNYMKCRISEFDLPKVGVSEPTEVFLNDEDIADTYELDFNIGLAQGACIRDGMLYIAQGVPKKGNVYIRAIDLRDKLLKDSYNLKTAGLRDEPEGCFFWHDKLMISTISKHIYEIKIPVNR